jgi:hypothetical protein
VGEVRPDLDGLASGPPTTGSPMSRSAGDEFGGGDGASTGGGSSSLSNGCERSDTESGRGSVSSSQG